MILVLLFLAYFTLMLLFQNVISAKNCFFETPTFSHPKAILSTYPSILMLSSLLCHKAFSDSPARMNYFCAFLYSVCRGPSHFLRFCFRGSCVFSHFRDHKEVEHRRIDAFELWCWRRLLKVPWTSRRSNQSILKEINQYSLEGLMLKLKLQYFGHLMRRPDSLEKTLMLGKIEARRRRG